MTKKHNTAAWARRYVSKYDIAIVPIEPRRKFPRARDWGNKIISCPDIAESFFTANPDWNIGAALGPSRLCSLDVDCESSFRVICDGLGIDYDELVNNQGAAIKGGPEGLRIMFKVPAGAELGYHKLNWRPEADPDGEKYKAKLSEARAAKEAGDEALEAELRAQAREFAPYTVFELRAATDGRQRQDVLPPSIHPETEKPYAWITPPGDEVPVLPAWLLSFWQEFESTFKRQALAACPWAGVDELYKTERQAPSQRHYSDDGGLVAVARDYERVMRIEDALESYGYRRVGRNRYLAPSSSTGLAGVVLLGNNKCWIHHASDPLCSDSTGQPVSSFDLFCEYEHNGDFAKAARELADASGVRTDTPARREPVTVDAQPEPPMQGSGGNMQNEQECGVSSEISGTSFDISAKLVWTDKNNKPLNHHENLREIARRAGITIRYNVISKEEEILIPNRSYSRDNQANAAFAELASTCSLFDFPTSKLQEFVTLIADQNQYSPVEKWVRSKPWDGVVRIHDFLNTVRAKGGDEAQSLKNTLISRWMLSAIRAAFSPTGVEAHGILVFAGAQGIGKTSWLKSLVPKNVNEQLELVKDGLMLDTENKDSVFSVLRYWIVELGEIDATLRRSELARLKAFVTAGSDVMRRPYARKESVYARRAVLFGSVNNGDFLQDDTGNRRFWVVDCEHINYEHGLDMQQVWAEFLHYYEQGEKWYLSPSELAQLNEHNRDFEAADPVKDRILGAYDWDADKSTWRYVSATDALIVAGIDRPTRSDATRAGVVLREMNGNDSTRCRNRGRLLLVPPLVVDGKNSTEW